MKLPAHMNMTKRQFKAWKRKELKKICDTLRGSDITTGGVYLPNEQYLKLSKGINLLYQVQNELRPWWKGA